LRGKIFTRPVSFGKQAVSFVTKTLLQKTAHFDSPGGVGSISLSACEGTPRLVVKSFDQIETL